MKGDSERKRTRWNCKKPDSREKVWCMKLMLGDSVWQEIQLGCSCALESAPPASESQFGGSLPSFSAVTWVPWNHGGSIYITEISKWYKIRSFPPLLISSPEPVYQHVTVGETLAYMWQLKSWRWMISFNMRIKYVHEKMSLLGVGKRRKATDELQIGWRNVEGEL